MLRLLFGQRSRQIGGGLVAGLRPCFLPPSKQRHFRWASTCTLTAADQDGPGFLSEHVLQVNTCGDLYREWRKTRQHYRHAPTEGIDVDVPFVCSRMTEEGAYVETGRPLAVLLHGAPGSYRDFSENLIPRLQARGVDILAPNFPDMAFSLRNKFFWHTVEERTALLGDFLKKLGVNRIDALVAHSASIYPSLRLLLEGNGGPKVKSLVLLAPNSHITPQVLKPLWATDWMIESYRNSFLRPLVSGLVLLACYFGFRPNKPVVQDVLLSLTTYKLSGFDRGGEKLLEAVAQRQLPTLVAISKNDRLLCYRVLMGVCSALGASPEDLWYYDKEGKLTTPGTSGSWLKVLSFEHGTHYPFVKHPDICADEIVHLLQRMGIMR
ncbi:uncharacterized protein LOC144175073 isoform X1 [Haemaphysalis longicornis]